MLYKTIARGGFCFLLLGFFIVSRDLLELGTAISTGSCSKRIPIRSLIHFPEHRTLAASHAQLECCQSYHTRTAAAWNVCFDFFSFYDLCRAAHLRTPIWMLHWAHVCPLWACSRFLIWQFNGPAATAGGDCCRCCCCCPRRKLQPSCFHGAHAAAVGLPLLLRSLVSPNHCLESHSLCGSHQFDTLSGASNATADPRAQLAACSWGHVWLIRRGDDDSSCAA